MFSTYVELFLCRGTLTAPFQTKIAINTNINTNTIVANMERNKAGADHECQPVRLSFLLIIDKLLITS
jgi:hypothetical protein